MMGMKLHKKSEKEMNYNISQIHKISYAFFSLIMLIGLFSAPLSTLFTFRSIIPLVFLLISLTGLGYREKWEFDAIKKRSAKY